jgi:AraC family transcriptional regulator, transcriptional activator of pobA
MKKVIPIHSFSEEDAKGVPVRHVPLNVRNDYDIATPHRHNYYEVFFFTKGGGTHTIDFVKYPVADNSVHVVFPQQIHVLNRHPSSYGSVVHFSRDLFNEFSADQKPIEALLNNNSFLNIANTPAEQSGLNIVLEQLKSEYEVEHPNAEILKSYLYILLLKCAVLFDAKNPEWKNTVSGTFSMFKQLVEEEYLQQKQPVYYAEKLKISERKLNELCKLATGKTVGEYLNDRVVLEAKRLLYNSPLNVKEIAFYLGFNDPSYFNRFFKRNTGATALAFREESGK